MPAVTQNSERAPTAAVPSLRVQEHHYGGSASGTPPHAPKRVGSTPKECTVEARRLEADRVADKI